MAQYDITSVRKKDIDFAPATEAEEILQNIQTILATLAGSVPLDREFGVEGYVDQPMAKAQAMMASDILIKIKRYEPRAAVTSITFTQEADGVLKPKVQVKINDTEQLA